MQESLRRNPTELRAINRWLFIVSRVTALKVRDAAVYSIERATFMHLLERGVLFSVLFLFSSMNDIQEVCTRNLPPKLIAIERNRWVIMCLLRPNIIATRRTTADPCSWNPVYGFNCQLRTLKCTRTNEKQRVSPRLYVSSRLCCIFLHFSVSTHA